MGDFSTKPSGPPILCVSCLGQKETGGHTIMYPDPVNFVAVHPILDNSVSQSQDEDEHCTGERTWMLEEIDQWEMEISKA